MMPADPLHASLIAFNSFRGVPCKMIAVNKNVKLTILRFNLKPFLRKYEKDSYNPNFFNFKFNYKFFNIFQSICKLDFFKNIEFNILKSKNYLNLWTQKMYVIKTKTIKFQIIFKKSEFIKIII